VSQSEPSYPELPRGRLFAERYEIEAVIGRGGMGAVYRARDLALGESIALKVLAQGSEAGLAEIMRFRQEVRLARKVTHPNVARVFDIGEHEGLVYLTMELLDGETLRQVLRQRGALPPAEAIRVARALCDGLRAAHAAGVVHRDLKPANVILAPSGRVVIMDFGIARSLTEASGLTVGAIGTPTYMAPEQLFSGNVDARTDVYALGLVIHEMLTGARPGAAGVRDLPPALADLVRRCTAPLADARPASVDEVARVLAEACGAPAAPPSADGEATVVRGAARDADTRPIARQAGEPALVTGTREPALAVLPFRYRGPKDEEGLGDAITDELVDVLARTRGMRVLGSGATARYRDARDPRDIGRDLSASAVIDGSAQIAGDKVRITVRLLETAGGVQLWSERFDGDLGDLLTLQETIAHRVAEELRLELTTLTHRAAAPAAAIELYLDGRHRLRAFDHDGAVAAAASLTRALELAPDFAPAMAAHAIACLRAWFWDAQDGAVDWEGASRQSVARALERAESLAETHLAAGILATHGGEYRAAARAIDRALTIAPTYADAHEYLGMLQCEAGRAEEGARRLRHAASLDPGLMYCGIFISRQHALRGRWEEAEANLVEMDRLHGPAIARLTLAQRVRQAAWRGDREALRRAAEVSTHNESPNWRLVLLYARALLGDVDGAELREAMRPMLTGMHNPRRWSLNEQLATEIYAARGEVEEAHLHLSRAATSVLVDLDWLDRCPILAPLRDLPDWSEIRRRVRVRADAVWST
jgi:serine/threonine-protein kinase